MSNFTWNPFFGNFDYSNSQSGGGGNITVRAGAGSPIVGTDFEFLGLDYKNTKIISTANESGDTFFENRAWLTPYVVDLSTTPGERGTYSSIQAAIDAAFSDGCTFANQRMGTIYIRNIPGFIIENLTIPAGICLSIKGLNVASTSVIFSGVIIIGDHTFGEGSFLLFENLYLSPAGGPSFMEITNPLALSFLNCRIDGLFTYTGDPSVLNLIGCKLGAFTFTVTASNSPALIENCNISGASISFEGGFKCVIKNTIFNELNIKDTASLELYNCVINSINPTACISGTSTGNLTVSNVSINLTALSPTYLFNFGGTLNLGSISISYPSVGSVGIFSIASPTVSVNTVLKKGNVTTSKTITDDYVCTNTDEFLWVDHTAAIEITLSNSMCIDQEIEIKDKSLNCSTYNIQIYPGSGQIDGQSSFVMNVDGQSVRIKFDGTNFFTL